MRGDYWIVEQEKYISEIEDLSIEAAIKSKYNIIIDAINLNPKTIEKWENLCNKYPDYVLKFKKFDIDLTEAIERDSKRENPVGKKIIKDFYNKYCCIDKRFILEQNDLLPKALIIDMDGTICLNRSGRNPYDYKNIIKDEPNKPVIDIIKKYSDHKILIVTGRDKSCKDLCIQWLNNNNIKFDEIFMREEHDYTKSEDLKRKIYNNYIKNKYYISFCLEDYSPVSKMFREEGLLCLQVC